MQFEFATATRIIFGAGALAQAGEIASAFGRRALVVTGRNKARAEPLLGSLREHGIIPLTFSVFGEPEVGTVEQGVKLARQQGSEIVIALGGGSAIDAAKAIAAMVTNEGNLLDYLEVIGAGKALTRPSAAYIGIPTTAGTGSEVTRNAVLSSTPHRVKVSLRSPLMLPRVALIDPTLTHDLPASLTASTGLDALTQLIEPFVCARANPMTDSLCVEGIQRVARSLRQAFENGSNAAARNDMSLASLFGGIALANAGLGAVHGYAGPIGGAFPAPHGAVCAALLPHVMEANIAALRQRAPQSEALPRYDRIAQLLTGTASATADEGVKFIRELVADLQIPALEKYGVTKAHVPDLVEKASRASSMKPNPIQLSNEELTSILERAI
jgi:alcohol dehydrogenase class IV